MCSEDKALESGASWQKLVGGCVIAEGRKRIEGSHAHKGENRCGTKVISVKVLADTRTKG